MACTVFCIVGADAVFTGSGSVITILDRGTVSSSFSISLSGLPFLLSFPLPLPLVELASTVEEQEDWILDCQKVYFYHQQAH